MAVDSFTAEGMDWTVDHTGDPALWTYAEALRLAIIERANVVGESVPASLNAVIGPGSPLNLAGHPTAGSISYFDTLMDTLILLFVNHTDHAGDWSGQSAQAPAPLWTASALLSAIGAGSRLYQKRSYPISWAWMKQQYDLLNMLRWTKQAATVPDGEGMAMIASVKEYATPPWTHPTPAEAWELAKTGAVTGGWSAARAALYTVFAEPILTYSLYSSKAGVYIPSAGMEVYPGTMYNYYTYMVAWRAFQRVQPIATDITTSIAHAAQLYARAILPTHLYMYSDEVKLGTHTYFDPNGRTENDYFVQQSWTPAAVNRHVADWVGPDPRLGPPTDAWPDMPVRSGSGHHGTDCENFSGSTIVDFTYILKWDVANGFQFVT